MTEASTTSDITLTFKRNLEAHFRDLLAGKCDRPYVAEPVLPEQAPPKLRFGATKLCLVGRQGALRDRMNQVQDYAQAQYLHPSYFSTVIKYKTGKSVNTWIAQKTLAESKAMLARSSESVQEIAFRLGFKDAAHFSRFFKKHTKLSPLSFRQSLQS